MDAQKPSGDYQNVQDQRHQEQPSPPRELSIADAGKSVDPTLRRLEWIAVALFAVNLLLTYISYSMYSGDKTWAYFATITSTATAVILLLSLLFSIFSMTAHSRFALAAAIVGTMISVVSLGINIMDRISEWGQHW